MFGLLRRVVEFMLPSPVRYWCSSCQMEVFDIKTTRFPVKHKIGLCPRCNRWRPVQVSHA